MATLTSNTKTEYVSSSSYLAEIDLFLSYIEISNNVSTWHLKLFCLFIKSFFIRVKLQVNTIKDLWGWEANMVIYNPV